MNSNENKISLKKEIQISTEQIPKEENINIIYPKKEKQKQEIEEEIYIRENEIIINKENEYKELNNINNVDYSNEIYIIENKNKKSQNKRKPQPIYTKIRTESCRNPKKKISSYIYKTGKPILQNNKVKSNLNKYIMNTAKYSIKNPTKEKSKNKYKKNKINETDINNINENYNNNYNIITNEISNLDDYGYNNNNINKTNYIYRRENDLNDFDDNNDINKINIITKTKKPKNQNKINSQKQPHKNKIMSFNSFNKLQDTKFKYVPNTTKGDGRITYICDYSQENNKDAYFIESPTEYNRHISIYPIKPKLKQRKKKNNKHIKGDKLKKEIEDSKKKFEKIREIEREIKNYFNLNGLDIVNRELYDQSATMIQATFRAYLLRTKLYERLNMYINIKNANDILKEIFLPRKKNHWENFINALFEYISIFNTNNNINIENEEENEVNLNSEKYQYLNEEFNEMENNKIKYIKKKPISYKYKQKPKNKIMIQPCISFYFDNSNNTNNKDTQLNSNKKEKEELGNDNIIKDTQESVELKLNDELKNITSNNKENNKIMQLKYVLKLINLKFK